ncbi:tRNA uridine synthase B [Sesbania bispinosa]|nr:tRNA uridine synthase B [Sesbania bispinosa]
MEMVCGQNNGVAGCAGAVMAEGHDVGCHGQWLIWLQQPTMNTAEAINGVPVAVVDDLVTIGGWAA